MATRRDEVVPRNMVRTESSEERSGDSNEVYVTSSGRALASDCSKGACSLGCSHILVVVAGRKGADDNLRVEYSAFVDGMPTRGLLCDATPFTVQFYCPIWVPIKPGSLKMVAILLSLREFLPRHLIYSKG